MPPYSSAWSSDPRRCCRAVPSRPASETDFRASEAVVDGDEPKTGLVRDFTNKEVVAVEATGHPSATVEVHDGSSRLVGGPGRSAPRRRLPGPGIVESTTESSSRCAVPERRSRPSGASQPGDPPLVGTVRAARPGCGLSVTPLQQSSDVSIDHRRNLSGGEPFSSYVLVVVLPQCLHPPASVTRVCRSRIRQCTVTVASHHLAVRDGSRRPVRTNGESAQDGSVGGQNAVDLAAGADGERGEDLVPGVLARARSDRTAGCRFRGCREGVPGQPCDLLLLGREFRRGVSTLRAFGSSAGSQQRPSVAVNERFDISREGHDGG